MKITFTADAELHPKEGESGRSRSFKAGHTYEVEDKQAGKFIKRGAAVEKEEADAAKAEAKAEESAQEDVNKE